MLRCAARGFGLCWSVLCLAISSSLRLLSLCSGKVPNGGPPLMFPEGFSLFWISNPLNACLLKSVVRWELWTHHLTRTVKQLMFKPYTMNRRSTFWKMFPIKALAESRVFSGCNNQLMTLLQFWLRRYFQVFKTWRSNQLISGCSINTCYGCHFWLKMVENFVLPPSLGPRTYFPSLAYP